MLFGKEAQYPHGLVLSQTHRRPQVSVRLVLGEEGLELNEKLYEVHSHAQPQLEENNEDSMTISIEKYMVIPLNQVT